MCCVLAMPAYMYVLHVWMLTTLALHTVVKHTIEGKVYCAKLLNLLHNTSKSSSMQDMSEEVRA
jgi:hypothetical protein